MSVQPFQVRIELMRYPCLLTSGVCLFRYTGAAHPSPVVVGVVSVQALHLPPVRVLVAHHVRQRLVVAGELADETVQRPVERRLVTRATVEVVSCRGVQNSFRLCASDFAQLGSLLNGKSRS